MFIFAGTQKLSQNFVWICIGHSLENFVLTKNLICHIIFSTSNDKFYEPTNPVRLVCSKFVGDKQIAYKQWYGGIIHLLTYLTSSFFLWKAHWAFDAGGRYFNCFIFDPTSQHCKINCMFLNDSLFCVQPGTHTVQDGLFE